MLVESRNDIVSTYYVDPVSNYHSKLLLQYKLVLS